MENANLMVESGQEKVSSGVERGVMMRFPIAQIDDFPEHPFKVSGMFFPPFFEATPQALKVRGAA